jgi:predicted DsbA family dithiol-disulfide isomerase
VRVALDSHASQEAVQADVRAAIRLGIHGTPVFLMNGLKINGMPPPVVLQRMIETELRRAARKGVG